MKKYIVGIILSTIILSTPVIGADINLTDMSVEDLVDLKNKINDELYAKEDFIDLYDGYYTVGKDIAPGEYTIKAYGEDAEDTSMHWYIEVYISEELRKDFSAAKEAYRLAEKNKDKDVEPLDKYAYLTVQEHVYCPMEYSVELEEGNVLFVNRGILGKNSKLVISQGAKKGLFMD